LPLRSGALWDDAAALGARLAPVHALMAAAVAGDGGPAADLYHWLRYQLGWEDAVGTQTVRRGAKGIRPLVALVACEAAGEEPERATYVAAAIELTHEFSLIHDDVQDGDRLRRGSPALWTVVGAAQAINAGDALFAIARKVLGDSPGRRNVRLDMLARYDAACLALAEGQYLDIAFESAAQVSPEAYEEMVRRKTGALLGAAAALGAQVGGAAPDVADALQRFGEAVGVAFQMQDDVLGLWGDPAATGKPAGADLLRRKKSLPVTMALAEPALGAELRSVLARDDLTEAGAAAAAAWLADAGLRDRVEAEARRWARDAERTLEGLPLAPAPAGELRALARAAVGRAR
jgi:geranylgeranyl diphosphate synthase type I